MGWIGKNEENGTKYREGWLAMKIIVWYHHPGKREGGSPFKISWYLVSEIPDELGDGRE